MQIAQLLKKALRCIYWKTLLVCSHSAQKQSYESLKYPVLCCDLISIFFF